MYPSLLKLLIIKLTKAISAASKLRGNEKNSFTLLNYKRQ